MNADSIRSALAVLMAFAVPAAADELLWRNDVDTYTATRDSVVVTAAPAVDLEIADDFQVTGEVRRAIVYGHGCFNCAGVFSTGVRVRIYDKGADGRPAAERYAFRLDADDPRFLHDLNRTGHDETVDITFPQPFAAAGEYFLSVQLEFDRPASWPIWSANHVTRRGSPVQMRDNLAGGEWQQHSDTFGPSEFDFAFALYGAPPGDPPSNTVAECGEWHAAVLPLPDGANATSVYASKSFGAEESWLVGGYDTGDFSTLQQLSLAYHRRGDEPWRIVPTPSPQICSAQAPCAQVWFNAIDGVAPDDVWAGGWRKGQNQEGFVGGQLFVAHWDGKRWSEIPAPVSSGGNGSEVVAIKALAADDVWFVGSWINGSAWSALALHWNGSELRLFETPFPPQGTPGWSFAGVDGVAGTDLWAVGHGSDGDPASQPYFAHWNGSDWQLADGVPAPGDVKEFHALLPLAADDVYAGGSWFTSDTAYGPVIVHYDGGAWSVATQDGGGGPMVRFGSNVLALGNPSVYGSGTSWTPQPGLRGFDFYGWSTLHATGPCNAVGAAIADVAGARRAIAVELKPIVFHSGFE